MMSGPLSRRVQAPFVGWFSLRHVREATGELGFRLRRDALGGGLASEGASAVVAIGFADKHLLRIVATTMAVNRASRRAMEKTGLTYGRAVYPQRRGMCETRFLRISAANIGPNRFHQNRTVAWLMSIPRSANKSWTLRSDRYLTYIITTWDEIDRDNTVWVVPGERMKTGEEFSVPLSDRAAEIIAEARSRARKEPTVDGFVFFGVVPKKPLSNMALAMLLRRMDRTAHGFRTSFRTWCSDVAHIEFEVAEACLSHRIGSAVSRAYARSDHA